PGPPRAPRRRRAGDELTTRRAAPATSRPRGVSRRRALHARGGGGRSVGAARPPGTVVTAGPRLSPREAAGPLSRAAAVAPRGPRSPQGRPRGGARTES